MCFPDWFIYNQFEIFYTKYFNINFTLHQSKNLLKSRLFSKRNKNWPNAMFATILLNFRNSVNLKKRPSKDTSCGFMRASFSVRPVITSMHLPKKSLLKCMTLQCSYAQTVCSRKTCLKFTGGNDLVVHYIFSWFHYVFGSTHDFTYLNKKFMVWTLCFCWHQGTKLISCFVSVVLTTKKLGIA